MLNGEILRTGLRPGGSEHWQVVKEKKGAWKPIRPEMAVLRKRSPRGREVLGRKVRYSLEAW